MGVDEVRPIDALHGSTELMACFLRIQIDQVETIAGANQHRSRAWEQTTSGPQGFGSRHEIIERSALEP